MNLYNYKKNLFELILEWVQIDYDTVTKQYCLINNETPWIYWLWNTKDEAISEYLSWFKDMILVKQSSKNENTTVT